MRRDFNTPRGKLASAALALRHSARRWRQRCSARIRAALVLLSSAGAIVVLMLLAGSTCAVAGVQLLHGTAWALITAAVILFVMASLLLRGIARG